MKSKSKKSRYKELIFLKKTNKQKNRLEKRKVQHSPLDLFLGEAIMKLFFLLFKMCQLLYSQVNFTL